MLVAEGIDANGIHWVETQPGETDRLIAHGEIDAFFSFRSSAGRWRLSQGGVATNFLNPATYGVDFYGDSIFTSSRLADENPGLVQRFVEASIAGWQYAATHDHEIADRIAAELERTVAVSNLQAFNRSMFLDVEALIALSRRQLWPFQSRPLVGNVRCSCRRWARQWPVRVPEVCLRPCVQGRAIPRQAVCGAGGSADRRVDLGGPGVVMDTAQASGRTDGRIGRKRGAFCPGRGGDGCGDLGLESQDGSCLSLAPVF